MLEEDSILVRGLNILVTKQKLMLKDVMKIIDKINPRGEKMTIIQKVRDTFIDCEVGTVYSRNEIVDMVNLKHGINKESIIPSDYCYNLVNKGKLANPALDRFKIFEWIARGKYKYLGENHLYEGVVLSNPRKEIR